MAISPSMTIYSWSTCADCSFLGGPVSSPSCSENLIAASRVTLDSNEIESLILREARSTFSVSDTIKLSGWKFYVPLLSKWLITV